MNQRINKKLLVFTRILLFAFILFNSSCNKFTKSPDPVKTISGSSKIVYTDVNPDTSVSIGPYHLDLNNDGITDFVITNTLLYFSCGDLGGGNGLRLAIAPADSANAVMVNALALDSAVNVSPDSPWTNTSEVLLAGTTLGRCDSYAYGSWLEVSDKYLGLKFTKGNNSYYGWARFTSTYIVYRTVHPLIIKGRLILQDYAYNSVPNQPIFAGQTK